MNGTYVETGGVQRQKRGCLTANAAHTALRGGRPNVEESPLSEP